jgi:dihydrofolate synthase/folylpolyglutamate synthase
VNFAESLSYLLSLGNEVLAMKLGLASTEKLLAALGNPQNNFLKIQIAGTNGKGSTGAFLDSICRRANIETGLYTSPHLVSITERIRINGAEISEKDFARHAARVRKISENLVEKGELESVPTFFEQVTAIAVAAFAEAKIELAILETGLGGRFDSVTATRAEIAAITPIDYDHQKILGDTLAEIAAEKAAIIRETTQKVIVAPQKKEAEKVISGRCREIGIEPMRATSNFVIRKDAEIAPMLYATFKTSNDSYPNVLPSLLGRHQFANAAVAIAVAETLRDFQFDISQSSIIDGLQTAEHRGRLEFDGKILFDGAHNVAGARALADYLDEFVGQPLTLVFGAMRDKNLPEIAQILFPKAARLILTKPDNPRAAETEELIKSLPENFDERKVFQTQTAAEALKIARQVSRSNLICVTGSLYLVGEAQKALSESVLER